MWKIPFRNLRRPSGELCPSRLHVTMKTAKHMNKSRFQSKSISDEWETVFFFLHNCQNNILHKNQKQPTTAKLHLVKMLVNFLTSLEIFFILNFNCAYVHVRATEERKQGNGVSEDNVEEKGGKRGGPKKLFKWNQEIRSDIINISRL